MEGIEEMGTVQKRKRKLIPEIKTGGGGEEIGLKRFFFGGGFLVCLFSF